MTTRIRPGPFASLSVLAALVATVSLSHEGNYALPNMLRVSRAQEQTEVLGKLTVTGGQLQGAPSETNAAVIAFRGVPYAAPPVGDLRWRPPQPVVAWDGVRDAMATSPICLQAGDPGEPQSEDCLFLNVWAPRETTEPLPVMVWIHGGGYRLGSSSRWSYDGSPLV